MKNRRIHPRSPYADHPPDFAGLAARHEGLRALVRARPDGSAGLDWGSPAALVELTRALLQL